MSVRDNPDQAIAAWLRDEARDGAPERLIASTRDQLEHTHQRRSLWPARRFSTMSTPIRVAAVAAVVVIAVAAGLLILPRPSGQGTLPSDSASPPPSPSGSAAAASSPTASPMPYVEPTMLTSGTYVIGGEGGTPSYTFTVPDGWESRFEILWKDRDGPGELAFGLWTVDNVFADPCHWEGSLLDPPVGPTAADLATALEQQVGRNASAPTDVVFGGYPAKRLELSIPEDLDVTTCDASRSFGSAGNPAPTEGIYRTWLAGGEAASGTNVPVVPSEMLRGRIDVLYIADVGGGRMVFDAWHLPGASAANVTELESAVASIQIQP
jgi:hypothetical protein